METVTWMEGVYGQQADNGYGWVDDILGLDMELPPYLPRYSYVYDY